MMNRGDVVLRPSPECRLPEERPDAPRLIEIGFGNGDFLVHLAKKRPDALVFGVEMSHTCVEKALSRIRQQNLTNVRLLCGDARFLVRECFADNSVERIYMSFPCPWPKERHARRRVTSEGFSGSLASVLKIGGVFEMATDEGWYADEAAQILGASRWQFWRYIGFPILWPSFLGTLSLLFANAFGAQAELPARDHDQVRAQMAGDGQGHSPSLHRKNGAVERAANG